MTNAIHTEDLMKNFGSFVAVNGVGFDVVKDADDVRKKIGVVTEKLVAYDRLTPLENLGIFGRLYEMSSQSIKQRGEEKKTVLLTTHYMDEADRLSNRIGIIDYGKIVALDTPSNLKASAGQNATLEDAFIKLTGTKIRNEPVKNNLNHRPRFNFGRRMR